MWRTFYGLPVEKPFSEAVDQQINYCHSLGKRLRLCIGTDSMVRGNRVNFATALVFIIVGDGGFMYVNKRREFRKMPLRERMMTEIGYSIETAYELEPVVKKHNIHLEIHADINQDPRFPSHASYHDAMGYIKSMGYLFVSKPDAFASSVCADRFTD
jgi:predicted RNase H-related nuclease YkuK (DUF458 family)